MPHMENKFTILRTILIASLLSTIIRADEKAENAAKTKEHNVLPALNVLPAGSVLKGVRIPRYNTDYTPASLLRAEELEVITKQHIQGTNVELTLYEKDGSIKANTFLNTVDYDQASELIKSAENLIFSGAQFQTTCQGLILDWTNRRGFLLGNNQTIIYLKKPTSMKDSNNTSNTSTPKAHTTVAPKALTTVAAIALATSPTILTASDLAEYSRLSIPSTEHVQKLHTQVSSEISQTEAVSKLVNDHKAQLIQAIAKAKATEIKQKVDDAIEPVAKKLEPLPIPPALKPEKGKDHVSIKSKGDMFFDANKGVMVFSKQVQVTHPAYSFSCDGELKVILAPKPTDKKLTAAEKAKLGPNEKFGDVSKIIATDNIALVGKDNDGNPVAARAGNLIYDHVTGAIILRGLHSRITTVDKQMKITEKNGHIRIDKDWHITAHGSQIDLNLEKLKKNAQ